MAQNSAVKKIYSNKVVDLFNKSQNFKTEKELCDYLEINMDNLCRDIFNDEYISHERESYIVPIRKMLARRHGNKTRVDFLIKCKGGNYLLECKNPTSTEREMNRGISQILDYIVICEGLGVDIKETWLLSTKFHPSITDIVIRFKLPINICIMNKQDFAIWKCNNGLQQNSNI